MPSANIPKSSPALRERRSSDGWFTTLEFVHIPQGKSVTIHTANTLRREDVSELQLTRQTNITYISVESLLHATLPAHLAGVPDIESASALGSTNSMTLEFLQLTCSFSSGSLLQSVRKTDPRASATKNSLLVVGWAQTVVSG